MLFSEPKIPQSAARDAIQNAIIAVSVLFSEPKIPQFYPTWRPDTCNFSFQCSSASRKFLNRAAPQDAAPRAEGFSALQRAENSSIWAAILSITIRSSPRFQCSSASRKFLNSSVTLLSVETTATFQCSSASRKFLNLMILAERDVTDRVSVLFSEPKIPQLEVLLVHVPRPDEFQCSSASRKFLNSGDGAGAGRPDQRFQCSSASRKFLNSPLRRRRRERRGNFSALQRAENSSIAPGTRAVAVRRRNFSALQRAENSSIRKRRVGARRPKCSISVLFSEPKIPQWSM